MIGINTRQCSRVTDPQRGDGFRSVSREIMVYLDPATGQIIDQWKNPWTGETVEVSDAHAPLRVVSVSGRSYYDQLRLRLGWTGRPVYRGPDAERSAERPGPLLPDARPAPLGRAAKAARLARRTRRERPARTRAAVE